MNDKSAPPKPETEIMKRLLSFLFGRRARKIMLPSLVQQWQDDDAVLSRMISQQWHAAGVQALFQIMETEAAAETQLALADRSSLQLSCGRGARAAEHPDRAAKARSRAEAKEVGYRRRRSVLIFISLVASEPGGPCGA